MGNDINSIHDVIIIGGGSAGYTAALYCARAGMDTLLVEKLSAGGQINVDKSGYIIADESTKTNIPGVFAAGDVRTKILRQIVTATADGAVASHFAEEYV